MSEPAFKRDLSIPMIDRAQVERDYPGCDLLIIADNPWRGLYVVDLVACVGGQWKVIQRVRCYSAGRQQYIVDQMAGYYRPAMIGDRCKA